MPGISRGPQILALVAPLNPGVTDLTDVTLTRTTPLDCLPIQTNYAANWMGEQAYSVQAMYRGQPKKLLFVPFADAVNYRVWLAQSKASSDAETR